MWENGKSQKIAILISLSTHTGYQKYSNGDNNVYQVDFFTTIYEANVMNKIENKRGKKQNILPACYITSSYQDTSFFFVGYLEQGLLVRNAAKLRRHYFSTKGWRLDLLSILPTDIAYLWWPPSSCNARVPCPVIVRINRLLRMPRMWEWFDRTETATGYPNVFRICKVSILFFL